MAEGSTEATGLVYLHYEDHVPEFTLKVAFSGAVTVQEALESFAQSYAGTGSTLQDLRLRRAGPSATASPTLAPAALLPCGAPRGSDLIVSAALPPKPSAITSAPDITSGSVLLRATAASPLPTGAAPGAKVYAKEGSAIAASQAKMGENSYYYSVGKHAETAAAPASVEVPKPRAVLRADKKLPEQTFSSYSMMDGDKQAKVHVPLAGASELPEGAVTVDFRDRSFDLKVVTETKLLRLHVPILLEEISQRECSCRKRQGKLIIILAKKDPSKSWYELRKTKGIGDTEFSKIVPDGGESVLFTI